MSNPENYSSSEYEMTSLRSELAELFQTHANIAAFQQPDDWEQPIEIVLGGCCIFTTDDAEHRIEIQVRQRQDPGGTNYLIITEEDDNFYWRQIDSTRARQIFYGSEAAFDDDKAMSTRFLIRAENTVWHSELSESYALQEGLFERAEYYAMPKQPKLTEES